MSAARILVVDDEADIRSLVKEILSEEGYEVDVAANGAEARTLRQRQQPDLVLLDIWMPDVDGITLLREWSSTSTDGCPVVMMSGHGTVDTAVEATRLGAMDFVEKPLSLAKLLRTVEKALEGARARKTSGKAKAGSIAAPVGKSRLVQQLRNELLRHANGNAALMLLGEFGSGREAFARFIHDHGPRSSKPFVVITASALRDMDAEAALFGTSGNGGLIEQVGDTKPKTFEARVLSSAQPDIEQGVLRRDLMAHLGATVARVPPLREYAEDVPDLLRHYVDRLVDSEGLAFRRFSIAAQNRLRNYPWPGNVQELRAMVRRLLQQGGAEEVSLDDIERELSQVAPPAETLVKQDLLALGLREAREHFERAYLQQQLLLCHGKVGQLAKRVGMERTHLYRKLRALGVDFRSVSDDVDA
jgi:DNA-binding NtrC family response regulator